MSRECFKKQVVESFRAYPFEGVPEAEEALLTLYGYLVKKVEEGERYEQEDLHLSRLWFQIQQAMIWTPLRFFLEGLADDGHLAIRAAAKGILCEKRKELMDDPEVGLVIQVNLAITVIEEVKRLQAEITRDADIRRAGQSWRRFNQGSTFMRTYKKPDENS